MLVQYLCLLHQLDTTPIVLLLSACPCNAKARMKNQAWITESDIARLLAGGLG
jgi:hypothetical protein